MTNGEKITALTGRKPLMDFFRNPYMVFTKEWWNTEYKEPNIKTPSMLVSEAVTKLTNATFSDAWQGDEELTTAYRMAIDALSKSESYINRFDAIIQLSHDLPNCTLPEINECLAKMPTLRSELK